MQEKWHVGRSWQGHMLEDSCPCQKAACGLAVMESAECDQHSISAVKTLRQGHPEGSCPDKEVANAG